MFRSGVAGPIRKPSIGAPTGARGRRYSYYDTLEGVLGKTLTQTRPGNQWGIDATGIVFHHGLVNDNANPGLDSLLFDGKGALQFDQAQGNTPTAGANCMPAISISPEVQDHALDCVIEANPLDTDFVLLLAARASIQSGTVQHFIGAVFRCELNGGLTIDAARVGDVDGYLVTQYETAQVYQSPLDYAWPRQMHFRLEVVGQTRTIKVDGVTVYADTFEGLETGDYVTFAPLFKQTTGAVNQTKILSLAVENLYTDLAAETAAFTDAQTVSASTNVTEAAALTDAQALILAYNVTETAAASSTAMTTLSATTNVTESAAASSQTKLVSQHLLTETAALTDAHSLGVASNLAEAAAFTDTYAIFSTLVTLCVEALSIADAQSVGPTQLVTESAVATDATSNSTEFTNNVVETAALTDAQTIAVQATTLVTESAGFTDTTTQVLAAIDLVVEALYAGDETKGGGLGAWSAHLESFAMSRFTNYPFQSMAMVDGVLVGVSDEGVYRLDQDDDAGAAIEAGLVFDWSDKVAGRDGVVSTPNLKHTKAMYVDGAADGQMAVAIGHVANGQETESSYTFTPVTGGAFATSRVPLGKGIRSRYLRPSVSNVGGADFNLNGAKIDVDLSRRTI